MTTIDSYLGTTSGPHMLSAMPRASGAPSSRYVTHLGDALGAEQLADRLRPLLAGDGSV